MNNFEKIAKTMLDQSVLRTNLAERIQQSLVLIYNDGLFMLTPELFSLLYVFDQEEIIIKDSYNNPIKINRTEFTKKAKQKYNEVMNEWYTEFENLKHIRKETDL